MTTRSPQQEAPPGLQAATTPTVPSAPPGLLVAEPSVGTKEEAVINLQKPSPIFGHQKKAVTKKPTAHVKPHVKSNTDGFTTMQASRQPTTVQTGPKPAAPSSGSRVSELDDFSADIPAGPQACKVEPVADATSSSASNLGSSAPANTSSKSKKRKKKNKEVAESGTEVILPKMAVPTESSEVEGEKAGKKGEKSNKKKKNNKPSPPLARKMTPPQKPQQESGKPAEGLPKAVEENIQDFEKYQKLIQSQVIIETLTNIAHGKPPLDKIPEAALRLVSQDTSALAAGAAGGKITASDHEVFNRLTESTEKLLKNVLFETEAIKLNTEQISKDLKSALEKCKVRNALLRSK